MNLDLSILICSLPWRTDDMNANVIGRIKDKRVEVIYLGDNKSMSVGEKRNWLLRMAKGKYVAFIDDDDIITKDYCKKICDAAKEDSDVIVFGVACSVNGSDFKPVNYSIKYKRDTNHPLWYQRRPNHLMAVKREIALNAGFPEKNMGEDSEYAKRLMGKLRTQTEIKDTLYYYIFSHKTSETQ